MNLKMLFDFIQVLLSKMKHSTKDDYLFTRIKFIIIYLLPKEGLNHK
jgi:hypothetical protein